MIIDVFCEICTHHVAQADTDSLCLPLRGWMFTSPMPDNMPEPPFAPEVDWEWMRCPMCGHRPFVEESVLVTARDGKQFGTLTVPKQAKEDVEADKTIDEPLAEFVCEHCGKVCKTKAALIGHTRWCKHKEE